MFKYRFDPMEIPERKAEPPLVRYSRILLDKDILEESPITLATFRFEPGQKGVDHKHDDEFEIYYGLRGEGVVEFKGEKNILLPGVALFIPPLTNHYTYNTSNEDFEFLSIFPSTVDLSIFKNWKPVNN